MTTSPLPWRSRAARALAIEPDELAGCLWSAAYHFLVLTGLFLARPVREALGSAKGATALPWLYTGTFTATLLLTPVFGCAFARLRLRALVRGVYWLFAAALVLACALLGIEDGEARLRVGYAFYVGYSAANLFATAVFWAVMVDVWRGHQGKRVFGVIAAGGTLGTIAGSAAVGVLAERLGIGGLLLLAALALCAAAASAGRVLALRGAEAGPAQRTPPTWRDALAGAAAVGHSPFLRLIALYLLLDTLTATFLYYHQAAAVAAAAPTAEARTRIFGLVNLTQNALTVVVELLLTARVVRWLGIGGTLAIEPLVSGLSFAGLIVLLRLDNVAPMLAVVAIAICQVVQRTAKYAFTRPAREVLFTSLTREQKYRAKAFLDTAIYRGGDMAWAWLAFALEALTQSLVVLSAVGAPLALGWAGLGLWLGRAHRRRAGESSA